MIFASKANDKYIEAQQKTMQCYKEKIEVHAKLEILHSLAATLLHEFPTRTKYEPYSHLIKPWVHGTKYHLIVKSRYTSWMSKLQLENLKQKCWHDVYRRLYKMIKMLTRAASILTIT